MGILFYGNMIKRSIFLSLTVITMFACKGQKKAVASQSNVVKTQTSVDTAKGAPQAAVQKIDGVVSHRYSSDGCPAVVITDKVAPNGDTLVLIPVHGLEGFDDDGLKISFNYRRSMIRTPSGCHHGIPAMLYNVTKR